MEMFCDSAAEPKREVETADSGKIGEQTTVEKMDRCSFVGVKKVPGGIQFNKIYTVET